MESAFQHLEEGGRYVVVQPFVDFEGIMHRVGEAWTFFTATSEAEGSVCVLHVEVHARPVNVRLGSSRAAGGIGRVLERLDRYVVPFPARRSLR